MVVVRHTSGGGGQVNLEVTEEEEEKKRFSSTATVDVNWLAKGEQHQQQQLRSRRSQVSKPPGAFTQRSFGGEFE